jgi:hypothetical protein
MPTTTSAYEVQRRSTRVRLEIPVVVTSLDSNVPFSGPARTLVVNPQGCGVRLNRALNPGTTECVEKLPEADRVAGRVANCCPIGSDGKFYLVGIAFDAPANVWGLADQPADWGPAKPSAQIAPAPVVSSKKDHEWPFSQFSRRGEFHPGRK